MVCRVGRGVGRGWVGGELEKGGVGSEGGRVRSGWG